MLDRNYYRLFVVYFRNPFSLITAGAYHRYIIPAICGWQRNKPQIDSIQSDLLIWELYTQEYERKWVCLKQ